jgi:hypothetical protein
VEHDFWKNESEIFLPPGLDSESGAESVGEILVFAQLDRLRFQGRWSAKTAVFSMTRAS